MRVQEAFPVDYFVFSCIAPNFPAEKKWMWCWFQTIWAAHLDELFILQLLFLFTVFLTCFRPPRAIARAEMYLNEQKWIFCLFYQSRYFNLKEISGSPWETTDFVISNVPPHRALESGGWRTISFLTLSSISLDRNGICHIRILNQKPILAREVTQDAKTGWIWTKKQKQFCWAGIDHGVSQKNVRVTLS